MELVMRPIVYDRVFNLAILYLIQLNCSTLHGICFIGISITDIRLVTYGIITNVEATRADRRRDVTDCPGNLVEKVREI